jgi:hypothetical protein
MSNSRDSVELTMSIFPFQDSCFKTDCRLYSDILGSHLRRKQCTLYYSDNYDNLVIQHSAWIPCLIHKFCTYVPKPSIKFVTHLQQTRSGCRKTTTTFIVRYLHKIIANVIHPLLCSRRYRHRYRTHVKIFKMPINLQLFGCKYLTYLSYYRRISRLNYILFSCVAT